MINVATLARAQKIFIAGRGGASVSDWLVGLPISAVMSGARACSDPALNKIIAYSIRLQSVGNCSLQIRVLTLYLRTLGHP